MRRHFYSSLFYSSSSSHSSLLSELTPVLHFVFVSLLLASVAVRDVATCATSRSYRIIDPSMMMMFEAATFSPPSTPPLPTNNVFKVKAYSNYYQSERFKNDNIPPVRPSKCGHSRYYNHVADKNANSIVGGFATLPNEYPWIVRLQIPGPNNETHLCSANIVAERYLVTAAHCVIEHQHVPRIIVVIGEHDIASRISSVTKKFPVAVSAIFLHPNYSSSTNDYDIAILKIEKKVLHEDWTAQPICLPKSCSDGCHVGSMAQIAGWGATSEFSARASLILQKATVSIVSSQACSSAFANLDQTISPRMMCAGFALGGVDTCFGDSGGPLMSATYGAYTLCGVTAFGDGCGKPGVYGVYTRICTVLPWLQSIISAP